jgi:hypothetical protein
VKTHSRRDGIPLLIRARNDFSMMGFLRRPIAFILKTA